MFFKSWFHKQATINYAIDLCDGLVIFLDYFLTNIAFGRASCKYSIRFVFSLILHSVAIHDRIQVSIKNFSCR